jgi:hypothetical protein
MPDAPFYSPASWMNDISSSIGSKTLTQIALPGSHDSGAYDFTAEVLDQYQTQLLEAVVGVVKKMREEWWLWPVGWLSDKVVVKAIKDWSKAQNLDIGDQLNAGVRWLDLRTMIYEGQPYLFHGFVAHSASEALDQVKSFLNAQPKEIVILSFSHMPNSMTTEQHVALANLIQTKLGSSAICPDLQFRTIGEMQQQGTRAVVFYTAPFTGRPDWLLTESDFLYPISCEAETVGDLISKANAGIAGYTGPLPVKVGFTITPGTSDIMSSISNQFDPFSGTHDLHWFTGGVRDSIDSWMTSHAGTKFGVVSTDFINETNLVADCVNRNSAEA